MLTHKTVSDGKISFSYYERGAESYTDTLIFLSPGASTGRAVGMYLEFFPQNLRVISPDLPGRGGTTYVDDNSLENIGRLMNHFVEMIGVDDAIIAGVSFGGSVAHEMCRAKDYKKVYLVASGEYFTPLIRTIITTLFYLPTVSLFVQRVYVFIFLHIFPFFGRLEQDDWTDTRGLFAQWLKIVNYRISMDKTMHLPAELVFLKNDSIVQASSIKKLQKCYPNSVTTFVNVRHALILKDEEKTELSSFFKGQFN
jgi:pimeloyl-ACP methyl ester carboxylesterase